MCSLHPSRQFLLKLASLDDKIHIYFEGFEHAETGKIKIEELKFLTLPNGVEIKFEEIVALAGDYYGLPNQPIIDPAFKDIDQEDSGRHQRFRDAYSTLARTPKTDELQNELDKLLATLQKEIETGVTVDASTWDEITGGVWVAGVPVKLGRMMQLAETNYDHFLPHAKNAYLAGHQLAIDKAREAGNYSEDDKDEQKRLLHEAFSLEAFSCHFLTDSFASGHIRTPRVELGKSTRVAKVGSLLCKYMHNEDNKYGLRVQNKRGDKWIAYGDGMLLKEESKSNLEIALEAVQESSDQVYRAYKNPSQTLDPAAVTDLIPFVDREERNNSPLFQVKDAKLHRRADVNNLQDKETITNWWGLTTSAKLLTYKPKNSAI